MHASGFILCVLVCGVKGCTHSIRLHLDSGRVYSVRYMFSSGMMLRVIVDKSVLASVGRALCFRFVGGAVVVLLLL